ncbi:MAG: hypothetical protein ACTSXH_07825 [Promethearchaeota archaeon]
MQEELYNAFISKIKQELNADCAIANKYGIILASNMEEYSPNKIISLNLLDLILEHEHIESDLNNKEIKSIILQTTDFNHVFLYNNDFILISKFPLTLNTLEFSNRASNFLIEISDNLKKSEMGKFTEFDFSKEVSKIKETLEDVRFKTKKYDIIKDLIKSISK